ncbi:RsmD family RNA methyltransferase [Phycisphaerales bacterium AB-hyl4]|uniref:RsmD family RNA methyltransferase n=1 Tax=Natronomicrosphaera hydrolytica TaxID=3242702 RepID=A0ABV4U225_9BACT
MRIIAGVHRGRRLVGPKDATTTRPITDRVKQSLFDRLWAMGVLPEDPLEADEQPADERGLVLDLFAGTGSLGLESLSRGAGKCVFVEMDRDALHGLEQNLSALRLSDRANVLKVNALSPGWLVHAVRKPVRIAFVDPPYAMMSEADGWERFMPLLEALAETAEAGGVMVVRTPTPVESPEIKGWVGPTSHKYGGMKVTFYERAGGEGGGEVSSF